MNRWADVVDIDVLRRLFENALAPCRIFFQGNQWIFSAREKRPYFILVCFFVGGVPGPGEGSLTSHDVDVGQTRM